MQKLNIPCFIGLPNDRKVTVVGYDAAGKLAYHWDGNNDLHHHIEGADIAKALLPILWHAMPERRIARPDVIVNCISDVDIAGKSLAVAAKLVESIHARWPEVPVFNHPKPVMSVTRDSMWKRYHTLPGLHFPKTIRMAPLSGMELLDLALRENIAFPFLVRPCGAHQGEGLRRIDNAADVPLLENYAFDGREYYITEFVDYRGADGLYRKARLVAVGAEILPRHYMTGEDWLVHGNLHETYMATREDTKKDEAAFIRNYRSMIHPQALASLEHIAKDSKLEHIGFDVALGEDGTLLVFEINPAQNSFLKLDEKVFPHMKGARDTLVAALNTTIRRMAAPIPQTA